MSEELTCAEFVQKRCEDTIQDLNYAADAMRIDTASWNAAVAGYTAILNALVWHKNWPVLVEGPAKFETDPIEGDVNHMSIRMTQQYVWTTQQEYIKHFGTQPPTAPLIRKWAQMWKDHPEFKPEWEL